MAAPSGLLETEEFVGLITTNRHDDDNDGGLVVELTKAASRMEEWKPVRRSGLVGGFNRSKGGWFVDDDDMRKKRHVGFFFAGASLLFSLLVLYVYIASSIREMRFWRDDDKRF
jgi:hypothetical protein